MRNGERRRKKRGGKHIRSTDGRGADEQNWGMKGLGRQELN